MLFSLPSRALLSFGAAAVLSLGLSACGDQQTAATVAAPDKSERLIQDRFSIHQSALDAKGTLRQLLEALDRRDLTVFAVINHAAGAESVGMELPASTLVIFGNPQAGTPLIASRPLIAAELPMKALIFEADGETQLAITGINFLAREYNLGDETEITDRLRDVLGAIAAEATASPI